MEATPKEDRPPREAPVGHLRPGEELFVWAHCTAAMTGWASCTLAITSDRILFADDFDRVFDHVIAVKRAVTVEQDPIERDTYMLRLEFVDTGEEWLFVGLKRSVARELGATLVPDSADRYFSDDGPMLARLRDRHEKINARASASSQQQRKAERQQRKAALKAAPLSQKLALGANVLGALAWLAVFLTVVIVIIAVLLAH
jgi:hypothetical protein